MFRTQYVREKYRRFLIERSPSQRSVSVPVFVCGIIACATIALLPIGIYLLRKSRRPKSRDQSAFEAEMAFIDRAEAVMALPLMVNTMFRSPGNIAAPGLVIISFEPETETGGFMAEVVLKVGEAAAPYTDELLALMKDEEYKRGRRRRLPDGITSGRAVYACDVAIPQWYLPNQQINDEVPFFPCLAEPGEHGQIRAIPYWCAVDVAPPPWAAGCRVAVM